MSSPSKARPLMDSAPTAPSDAAFTAQCSNFMLRPALSLPNLAERPSLVHMGTFSNVFRPMASTFANTAQQFKVPASPASRIPVARPRHLPVLPVCALPVVRSPQAKRLSSSAPSSSENTSLTQSAPSGSSGRPSHVSPLVSPVALRTRLGLEKKAQINQTVLPPPGFSGDSLSQTAPPPGFKKILNRPQKLSKTTSKEAPAVRGNRASQLRCGVNAPTSPPEVDESSCLSSPETSPRSLLARILADEENQSAARSQQIVDHTTTSDSPSATNTVPDPADEKVKPDDTIGPTSSSSSEDEADIPVHSMSDPFPDDRVSLNAGSLPSFSSDDASPAPAVPRCNPPTSTPSPDMSENLDSQSLVTPDFGLNPGLSTTRDVGPLDIDQFPETEVAITLNASSSSSAFESPPPRVTRSDSPREDSIPDDPEGGFTVVRNNRGFRNHRRAPIQDMCPSVTSRMRKTIHFVFPLASPLKCTERNCAKEFVTQHWTATKHSLVRHLEQLHRLSNLVIERWCSLCQAKLPARLSKHRCFRNISFCPPHSTNDHAFKCDHCNFSCPSANGLRNHLRSHRAPRPNATHRRQDREMQRGATASGNTPPSSLPPSTNSNTSSPVTASHYSLADHADDVPDSGVIAEGIAEHATSTMQPEVGTDLVADPDAPAPSDPFLEKFRQLHENFDEDKWMEFEDILQDFICFGQKHVSLPPVKEFVGPPRPSNPDDPSFIQKLYRRNRRRVFRLLTQGESSTCSLPVEDLLDVFFPTTSPECDLSIFSGISPANAQPGAHPFSAGEVSGKLAKCENSAPGIDRLTYAHWRGIDPDGKALAAIFNICLKARKIPASWKLSKTIFLPKDGDLTSAKNWRPISLSSTIYKLFTGLLSKRLSDWIEEHAVLSPCQKGFRPFDGAFENNYVVNQKFQSARVLHHDLCLLSIDVSNAFGSVPHAALIEALAKSGAGDVFTEIIADIYKDSFTHLATADGLSDAIQVLSGVKQGCPLSGTLFNIVIDPLLRAIQKEAVEHKALAFADDILLLGSSPIELQEAADQACAIANRIGLSVNAAKCFSIHLSGNPVGCLPTPFTIGGTNVHALADSEPAPFLGKPIGYRLTRDEETLQTHQETADKILTSFLAPWQRIDALKSFFYPATAYAMRTGQFAKGDWERMDKHIRPMLKNTLSLPPRAANDYIYGSTKNGLFGVPVLSEDSDFALVDSAFKLLSSRDEMVRNLAWDDLRFCVEGRIKKRPSTEDLAAYMSGTRFGKTSNKISTIWTRARSASKRLKITWNIHDDHTLSINIADTVVTNRTKVMKTLRDVFRSRKADSLGDKAAQGKTYKCFSKAKASTHFHRTGDFLRFTDWRFVHKARLGLVNLNACRLSGEPGSRACRRCGYPSETLPHVVCHCHRYMRAITARHNRVVNRIKDAAKGRWGIYSENQPLGTSHLKPDLVLVKDKEALILDITVPFENGSDAFTIARRAKEEKYADLAKELGNRFEKIKVEAIIVGALGSWDPRNDRVVSRVCSKKYAKLMRKLIVSDTIRASRDIYIEHLTGTRQTDARSRYGRRRDTTEYNTPATQDDGPTSPERPSSPSMGTRQNESNNPAGPPSPSSSLSGTGHEDSDTTPAETTVSDRDRSSRPSRGRGYWQWRRQLMRDQRRNKNQQAADLSTPDSPDAEVANGGPSTSRADVEELSTCVNVMSASPPI